MLARVSSSGFKLPTSRFLSDFSHYFFVALSFVYPAGERVQLEPRAHGEVWPAAGRLR